MTWSRRQVARLILGAPFAAPVAALLGGGRAAAGDAAPPTPPGETPLGKFLARDARLRGKERDRVVKDVAGLEAGLDAVRAYPLPNGVVPAGVFRALRSKRR